MEVKNSELFLQGVSGFTDQIFTTEVSKVDSAGHWDRVYKVLNDIFINIFNKVLFRLYEPVKDKPCWPWKLL